MPSCHSAVLFLVLKDSFSVSEIAVFHAPAYYFQSLCLSYFFLSDFSGLFVYRGPFLMDLWPGLCKELPWLEPGAGLTSAAG